MERGCEVPRWTEDDGSEVWLVLADGRGAYPELSQVEDQLRPIAQPRAVFGANAFADDQERLAQLAASGYDRALSMVDLRRDVTTVPARPVDVQIRSVTLGDHEAMHRLAAVVWAGRSFFVMPTVDSYRQWVADSDPELMLLACSGSDLVGYVAASVQTSGIRVDDLLVHPEHQRRGIATELIRRVVEQARRLRCDRITLETEGDDPVGARSFYESLGFTLETERLRFRKAVRSRADRSLHQQPIVDRP